MHGIERHSYWSGHPCQVLCSISGSLQGVKAAARSAPRLFFTVVAQKRWVGCQLQR